MQMPITHSMSVFCLTLEPKTVILLTNVIFPYFRIYFRIICCSAIYGFDLGTGGRRGQDGASSGRRRDGGGKRRRVHVELEEEVDGDDDMAVEDLLDRAEEMLVDSLH